MLSSPYFDISEFTNKYKNSNIPIVLSINIQCLNSKHLELTEFLKTLSHNKVDVVAIAIQEIWSVKHFELTKITGYQNLYCKLRTFSNGGGVGFFIKTGLNCKIINMPNLYHEKIFEFISIELTSKNINCTISSIYRSPTPIHGLSLADQQSQFTCKLDEFLTKLNNANSKSYVFLDANIDLSKINLCNYANDYADIILSNGYIQTLTKSTRIQGNSHSLIDHILINDLSKNPQSGIIISDISDHFFTFIEIGKNCNHEPNKKTKKRVFNDCNITMFKNYLSNLSWTNVTSETDVDMSFSKFWEAFDTLYKLCFPLKSFKFNKNINKRNDFMTQGLLTSRQTKNLLHIEAIKNPTFESINKYKQYRNLYNKTVRAMKQLHYEINIDKNMRNPKKNLGFTQKDFNGCEGVSKY